MGPLDEQGVGAHLLAGDGGGLEPQHIVLGLVQVAGEILQHFVAQGGAQVAAGQLAVGNGDDLVGVVLQLVKGHLIVRAQNVAQEVHQYGVLPSHFPVH